ncbi:MAG TPA: undecaprenyl-diphosphate phosphatase, partial [Acidobacteria bacterium]|nr:undecaprenyl-diphosphate phosphatase [Acidobacteriota bacterium]
MSWWQAALLGVLQGVTEFLPVSSSGHLALAQMLMPGFHQPGVLFDAMLHMGTAAAIVVFERNRLIRWLRSPVGPRMLLLLIVGTLVTAVPGLPLRHLAEAAFGRPAWVGGGLLVTGLVVLVTRFLAGGATDEESTSWRQVAAIGLAQGLAVFPGISRSGMTIATGLGAGLERQWAARFSFLLAVPAIAGATVVELAGARGQLGSMGPGFWTACTVGAVAAGISGYFA